MKLPFVTRRHHDMIVRDLYSQLDLAMNREAEALSGWRAEIARLNEARESIAAYLTAEKRRETLPEEAA
jgi:hypothetical protein